MNRKQAQSKVRYERWLLKAHSDPAMLESFRRRSREKQLRYKKRHPERVAHIDRKYRSSLNQDWRRMCARARNAVKRAIGNGDLVRFNKCQDCEISCSTEAHHIDYSRPLDVIWLCDKCHRKADLGERQNRKELR